MTRRSDAAKAAAVLGRLGGKVRSEAKSAAVRENGKLGGRPAVPYRDGNGAPVDLSRWVTLADDGWSFVGGARAYPQRSSAVRAAAKAYGWRR